MKSKLCRWNCGRKTSRRCGICLWCCDERDARDRRINAGLEAYVPPTQRPGHRFYKGDKQRSASQKASLTMARAARMAKITEENAPGGTLDA
jgi:hypothetical protein